MTPQEFFLPLLVIGLLATAQPTYAPNPNDPVVVNNTVNIDTEGLKNAFNSGYQALTGTFTSGINGLKDNVNGLKQGIWDSFTSSTKNSVKVFNSSMLGFTQFLLSTNPNVDSMQNLWQSITLVISSFYLIIFMIIGAKFLISGNNIEGREKAKEWLKNAFMMIIGVNASFLLYKLLLETATAITQFIWITGFENFFNDSIFNSAGFVLLIVSSGSIGLALITLFLRYVFLMLAVLLCPIGIFLYYTPKLQNWGKIIFNLIGMALFMQFIDVIIFVTSNQLMTDLTGQTGQAFVPALSFALVAAINIMMMAYAVLKSAFSISDNAPILSYAFGAISGQITTAMKAISAPKPAPMEGNMVH